jgi:hypothetical protein
MTSPVKGSPHTEPTGPDDLRRVAERLEALAGRLRTIADAMQIARVERIPVLHSLGVKAAIVEKLEPYTADAAKKASRRGARIDK